MGVPIEYTIASTGTLLDAAARIEANHSRSVLVLSGEILEGVISEGDILRALLRGADIRAPLRDFIHRDFKYLRKVDHEEALGLARRFGISLVPVVDEEFHLKDVISLRQVLEKARIPKT